MTTPATGVRRAGLATLLLLAAACASRLTVPPITTTPAEAPRVGKFVWHDLISTNAEGSRRFYTELLGWQFEKADGGKGYSLIRHDGRPIAGMLEAKGRPVNQSQWLSYVSVSDVDGTVKEIVAKGGAVLASPRDLPDRGRYAVVSDPQGALLALLRSSAGDPLDTLAAHNEWLWMELWTTDAGTAMAFYETLLGYQRSEVPAPGAKGQEMYKILLRDGRPRAGVIEHGIPAVRTNWLPYVRVADVDALVARVAGLGGRVIYAPRDATRGGSVAVIADPSGAAITLQEWPLPERPPGENP